MDITKVSFYSEWMKLVVMGKLGSIIKGDGTAQTSGKLPKK